MKKKIEKYLRSKNPDASVPIKDQSGRFLIGDDVEGCLKATQQSAFPPKAHTRLSRPLPHFSGCMMAYNTTPISQTFLPAPKRSYDMTVDGLYGSVRYPQQKRPCPSPRATKGDLASLIQFFQTLKGGYINGVYHSSLERRRLAEKTASTGSSEALNNLNLTPEERERLPPIFKRKLPNLAPYRGREGGFYPVHNPFTMPPQHMHWVRPSPLLPLAEMRTPVYSPFSSVPPKNNAVLSQPYSSSLKPSPLSRTKEQEKPSRHELATVHKMAFEDGVMESSSRSFVSTPTSREFRVRSSVTDSMSPLIPTPLTGTQRVDHILTPSLYSGNDWGTPSWGGEDAKILQEVLAAKGPFSSAVTPGFMQNSSLRASSHAKSQTPRVFFKDQLIETIDFKGKNESPLPVGPTTPNNPTKILPGSNAVLPWSHTGNAIYSCMYHSIQKFCRSRNRICAY